MKKGFRKMGIVLGFLAVWLCGGPALIAQKKVAPVAAPSLIKVGHVGHDHHLALYVAALQGERFIKDYGVGLKEVQPREVYDLVSDKVPVARLRLVKTGGAAMMPTAMSQGEIDLGLGGLNAVAKAADNGDAIKVICPLQVGGDMLVMRKGSHIANWQAFTKAAKSGGKPIKIGYKGATAVAKSIFEGAMKAEGISYGLDATKGNVGVILVNFASEASPVPLLVSGELDGFVMNQPAAAQAEHKGAGKSIADLAELPPPGRWRNHPCCCVAAKTSLMTAQPQAIKVFLKVLLLSSQLIHQDQALAIECSSKWTKNELAVAKSSVPTITYSAEPTQAWFKGMRSWIDMMIEMKFFNKHYAKLSAAEVEKALFDFGPVNAAAQELRAAKLLR